jgi:diguanylate cyclase (GGDEF)-like protein
MALLCVIGLEVERHGASGRERLPRGAYATAIGLLQVLLCMRSGGLHSPYFLLVASTCVFAGLTLRGARALYLTAVVVLAYVLGIRFTLGLAAMDAQSVVALVLHGTFLVLSTGLAMRAGTRHRATVATLEVESTSDPLTALDNRRAFLRRLDGELARSERFSWPITMLMVDLDHFKKLNDVYGHAVGDEVLVETARILRDTAGTLDHVARVGGEEFAIAAVAADPYHGRDLADRIVRAFRLRNWAKIRPGMTVTASVGVAVLPADAGRDGKTDAIIGELMERADRALYRVKQAGRDGFHVSDETPMRVAR